MLSKVRMTQGAQRDRRIYRSDKAFMIPWILILRNVKCKIFFLSYWIKEVIRRIKMKRISSSYSQKTSSFLTFSFPHHTFAFFSFLNVWCRNKVASIDLQWPDFTWEFIVDISNSTYSINVQLNAYTLSI